VSTHAWRIAGQLGLLLCLVNISIPSRAQVVGQPGSAQTTGTCSPTDYKILAANAVAIKCDIQPVHIPDAGGQLVLVTKNGQNNQILANVQVVSAATQDWLIVLWDSGNKTDLIAKNNYILNLQYQDAIPPLIVPIDATETLTLSAPQSSEPLDFLVTSHIAFAGTGGTAAYSKKPRTNAGKWPTCAIPSKTTLGNNYQIAAKCSPLVSPFTSAPTLADFQTLDLTLVGWQWVRLNSLPSSPIIPAALPNTDVLGGHPAFDPKSRFARQAAPATKDASKIYANIMYTAGVGTSPAWVLDGKYAVPVTMFHQYTLAPLFLANIGNGTVKGQTNSNTIDLGGTALKVFRPGPILQMLAFSPGATFETDRQFDRDNLLSTTDFQFFLKGLYSTQQQQSFRLYAKAIENNKTIQLSEITPPTLGYGLDFRAGIEAGGALRDTTVKASKGSATQVLPQYSIFRLVPQVHGLLQLKKFSFDESLVGRYLATDENTIVESPTHLLSLHPVTGWKGISVLTAAFALDSQGNFNLSVTFKDGFAPPTYQRVNAIQAGILVKY
jgi:hypothetical protein